MLSGELESGCHGDQRDAETGLVEDAKASKTENRMDNGKSCEEEYQVDNSEVIMTYGTCVLRFARSYGNHQLSHRRKGGGGQRLNLNLSVKATGLQQFGQGYCSQQLENKEEHNATGVQDVVIRTSKLHRVMKIYDAET